MSNLKQVQHTLLCWFIYGLAVFLVARCLGQAMVTDVPSVSVQS